MADGRRNHGGSRRGSGRKKGSGFANKLAAIVRERTDEILSELLNDANDRRAVMKSFASENMFEGWLYIIKDNKTLLHKVGITHRKNINNRIALYRTHNMDVEVIYVCRFTDVENIEVECHSMIKEYEKGDWFKCDMATLEKLLIYLSKQNMDGR